MFHMWHTLMDVLGNVRVGKSPNVANRRGAEIRARVAAAIRNVDLQQRTKESLNRQTGMAKRYHDEDIKFEKDLEPVEKHRLW